MPHTLTLSVPDGALSLDTRLGTLRALRFQDGANWIDALHVAPWLDEAQTQAMPGVPPVEKQLSGDFFCLPFGQSDGAPIHGWTANSPWNIEEVVQSGRSATAQLRLERTVNGARVDKELHLRRGEPLLYQTHRLIGGDGAITLAHHPMIQMTGAGRLSFSPKALAMTGDRPPEPGSNWLAYPAQSRDLRAFPGRDGPVDLHDYPSGQGNDDFITLVEAPGRRLSWTAVVREDEEDIVFVLCDPRVLPVTMLWYSNGGRKHAPWSGRHTGVLGIENGCTAGDAGQEAALGENAITKAGAPSHIRLAPEKAHLIRHVIGAIRRPRGWTQVQDISVDQNTLHISGDDGSVVHLPFDGRFFATS